MNWSCTAHQVPRADHEPLCGGGLRALHAAEGPAPGCPPRQGDNILLQESPLGYSQIFGITIPSIAGMCRGSWRLASVAPSCRSNSSAPSRCMQQLQHRTVAAPLAGGRRSWASCWRCSLASASPVPSDPPAARGQRLCMRGVRACVFSCVCVRLVCGPDCAKICIQIQ